MAACKTCLDNSYTPEQRREILDRELARAKVRVVSKQYHDKIYWYIVKLDEKQLKEFEKELHSAMRSLLRDRTIPKVIKKAGRDIRVGDRFVNEEGKHCSTVTKTWRGYVAYGPRDQEREEEEAFYEIEYVGGGKNKLSVSLDYQLSVMNDESE